MILKIYFIAIIGLFMVFSDLNENVVDSNINYIQMQGQEYHLVLPESGNFEGIDIPKKNFIIKKGGIANVDALHGLRVVVKEEKDNGKVILVRKDGKRFFNAFPVIHADLNKALSAGELVKK